MKSKLKTLIQKVGLAWLMTFDRTGQWYSGFRTVPQGWRVSAYLFAILATVLALGTARGFLTGLENVWILPLYDYIVPVVILGVAAMTSLESLIDEDVDAILAERRAAAKRSWWINIYFRCCVYAAVGISALFLFEAAAWSAYMEIINSGALYPKQEFLYDYKTLALRGIGAYLLVISIYEIVRSKREGGRHVQ